MKIAVCGSGFGEDKGVLEKAKEIGREVSKSGNVLLTGGCSGYPYAAVKGALMESGEVIAYSPAKDKKEHMQRYNFPFEFKVEYMFTGLGIPERNIPLVKAADAVVIVGGQIGTLNEFTIAFKEGKKIGVLVGSGGVTKLIPEISAIANKAGEKDLIIYEEEPAKLVRTLIQ